MAKVKSSESDAGYESKSETEKGIWIIDAKPISTISTTTKFHLSKLDEPEKVERLFHSQIWVKHTSLHFIVDSDIQKKVISVEVVRKLALLKTPHPQLYTILWLCQGIHIHVNQ
jgi:hypothetical protein